jgi:hypothetical protein
MQAERKVALNARIDTRRRRALDIAVARRGTTIQAAVEEALDLWILRESSRKPRKLTEAPLIEASGEAPFNLTGRDIDEILFG